jgi:uncharacterized Fe-S cluster-containing radical SAM superfamily protein
LEKQTNNWCPEIYRGLYVGRYNDDRISIAPCCQADQEVFSAHDFDFKKNNYLESLRSQIKYGSKPNACKRCWEAETVGLKSRRQSAIEFYNIKEDYSNTILESLDYSTTWACNLGCIMCGPYNSSVWARELNMSKNDLMSIGKFSLRKNNFLFSVDPTDLKKMHFNGGEPLINSDHVCFLKKVLERNKNKLFVSYNTNGTIYPSAETIDLWESLDLVKLFFSIDGIQNAYEYIRWPGKWQDTADNLLKMKSDLPGNVMFGFNITVGCYNLLEIEEVWKWFQSNMACNREGDLSDFNWQIAYNYDPGFASPAVKAISQSTLGQIPVFSGLLSYLNKESVENNDWIGTLTKIDSRRGTNWRKALKIGQFY